MEMSIRDQLMAFIDTLPEGSQLALLGVLSRMPDPAKLRQWSPAIGSISDEDAEEMLEAIEDGCERV